MSVAVSVNTNMLAGMFRIDVLAHLSPCRAHEELLVGMSMRGASDVIGCRNSHRRGCRCLFHYHHRLFHERQPTPPQSNSTFSSFFLVLAFFFSFLRTSGSDFFVEQ
jgi:hypothetical protein